MHSKRSTRALIVARADSNNSLIDLIRDQMRKGKKIRTVRSTLTPTNIAFVGGTDLKEKHHNQQRRSDSAGLTKPATSPRMLGNL